jgi:probable addiction module antidote protein
MERIAMATRKRGKEKFSRYDTADYLKSEEDMVAYLAACLEEGGDDPAFIAVALGNVARAHGMVRLAKESGITREGLYKALSAEGNPSLGTVLKVMKALGLKLTPQVA